MDTFAADLRHTFRLIRKAPGFTAVAIVTLALGIGANTAVFSAVDALLIRALPYSDPDRLVMVWEDDPVAGYRRNTPAPGNYTEWVRLNSAFAGMAATRGGTVSVTGDGVPEQLLGRRVTANFFAVLGVQPIAGRTFTEDEDRAGAPVVVISYGLWQRRYGGERSIVGRSILMNDSPREVVGVLPREFAFRNTAIDYWVPIHLLPSESVDKGSHYLNVVARLKAGISVEAADADMKRVASELARQFPKTNARISAAVVPIREDLLGNTRIELLVLTAAAMAVLLIACANLASLLLSRAVSRRGELAVRAALGATPGRLVRQMLIESMVLSLIGGTLGVIVAPAGIAFLAQMAPRGFPAATSSLLDARLLGFTVAVSIATGCAFSLLPALHAARAALQDALQRHTRGAVGGRGQYTRDALVVLQVAVAMVLLIAAGLMLRTLVNLRAIETGFRADHLLTLRTTLPASRYTTPDKRLAYLNRVLEQIIALPAVERAGFGSTLPFTETGNSTWFQIEGVTLGPDDPGDALYRGNTHDYLQTLGVRIVEGRMFDPHDDAAGGTVIVNESFARKYWPRDPALGHRVRFNPRAPYLEIVGVVRDARERGYELALKPGVYLPAAEAVKTWAQPDSLVVRATGDPMKLVESIRRIVAGVDPDQPITAVRTMDEILDTAVADRQQQTTLLASFAGLALLLVSVGLYGVLSYAVSQRTRELGLRMALGASAGAVIRMVLGRGVLLTTCGLAGGLAAAWTSTRAMTAFLYGVPANDPTTYAAVAGLLAIVGLAACLRPAMRAARLDPITVLREE